MAEAQSPVIIVGAGVVGLALGQALKKQNVPFQILERDDSPSDRGQGWAITIHWAMKFIKEYLPTDAFDRIEACQVDPEVAANDTGNFLFLNLKDCSVKWKIAPSKRWRVRREKVRLALLQGIEDNVHWGRKVVDVSSQQSLSLSSSSETAVQVHCQDGSNYKGRIVIGVEGNKSIIRRILRPDAYQTKQLPFRFAGVTASATLEQVAPLRALDPLLFQGCHPETGTFFWFSILDTPAINGTENSENPIYHLQINLSWPVKGPEDELADGSAARLASMKERAQSLAPVFRTAIENIPDGTEVIEIKLADWECLDWDNREGTVTLAGDSAHAMTMYRGEAANHGLLDAYYLSKALKHIYEGASQKATIDAYEKELRARTSVAVRLSRQACVDAHTWENLNEGSAVLTRRAIPDL